MCVCVCERERVSLCVSVRLESEGISRQSGTLQLEVSGE